MSDRWAVVPFVNGLEYTQQATLDLLAQSLPLRVLLVSNGASEEINAPMREFVERHHPRVLLWSWNPALPSLSALWNRACRFVWELGGTEVLICNGDVRLVPKTYERLLRALESREALFVSAVGTSERDWLDQPWDYWCLIEPCYPTDMGGPDFSCFLLAKDGHERYPFDESLLIYTEDCCAHREYMLGGDGQRIFSINLPYLHYASGTLKAMPPEQRQRWNTTYASVVARYTQLWGGRPNEETYVVKGDPSSAREGVTNPELQRRVQAGEPVLRPFADIDWDHTEEGF